MPVGLLGGIGHPVDVDHVCPRVEEDTIAWQAVPSCPADLLVVPLDRFRHVTVDDVPDVGLVDPHAEGHRGANDVDVISSERVVHQGALCRVHAGVVGEGSDPEAGEVFGGRLCRFPRQRVDDATLPATSQAELAYRLLHPDLTPVVLPLLVYVDVQVGSEERASELCWVGESELTLDVPGDLHRCGGGEREHGNAETFLEAAQVAVGGTKVMAPLADAVCLVDGNEP